MVPFLSAFLFSVTALLFYLFILLAIFLYCSILYFIVNQNFLYSNKGITRNKNEMRNTINFGANSFRPNNAVVSFGLALP